MQTLAVVVFLDESTAVDTKVFHVPVLTAVDGRNYQVQPAGAMPLVLVRSVPQFAQPR